MTIKVLIIDDSAFMRTMLSEILQAAPEIEVVGTAADPLIAREKIKALNPDVVTLDIEMPRMDGLSFLARLMALRPMPVVVVSTLTQRGTEVAIRALELGAVEIVGKPVLHVENEIERLKTELIGKIRIAARSKPRARMPVEAQPALIMDRAFSSEGRIVAIGASTGGVEALQKLISPLPVDSPPILVTQHMPQGFTSSFSRRLDQVSQMSVCEATDQQRVLPGHVYVAPGNLHLELARYGAHYICRVHDGATVSGHRPSVDVLFHSVAVTAGANAMGIILTGMGKDGAAGLLEMRKAGAHSFGESEVSCLIYGMPRVAKEMGATECEGDLSFLAHQIIMKRGVQNN